MDEYDDDMFLDEEDRRRLQEMTEKEREAEIFKRVEQREILLARCFKFFFSNALLYSSHRFAVCLLLECLLQM